MDIVAKIALIMIMAGFLIAVIGLLTLFAVNILDGIL